MSTTKSLHELGQSLWLDNITREILDDGTLRRYIEQFSVTGLTSNPTIFDEAIGKTAAYDKGIRQKAAAGMSGEALFIELALEDLRRAADLFRPEFDRTKGIDGWVSMEVSPLLANDTQGTIDAALSIQKQANRPNLYVKIPGTPAGVPAIEAAIFAGVPINVTLLFSREQYLKVADAYMRALERRIAAGLDPKINSVASVFVSRWDRAVADKVPQELSNRLGIAIMQRTYRAHCELIGSKRWKDLEAKGARKQRMLWASTGTKDPKARPDCMSKRWLRRTPSTPCLKRPCSRSRKAARCAASWRRMAAMQRQFWRVLPRPASMSTPSPLSCKSTVLHRLSNRGLNSCSASRTRARRWPPLERASESARRQAGARRLAGECAAAGDGLL